MDSRDLHRQAAQVVGPIPVGLLTVSDTRTTETDVNGRWLGEELRAAGHEVVGCLVVPDDPAAVSSALDHLFAAGARVVLINGGTGFSRRDRTFEAVSGRLERVLTGFGELFRFLSWEQVGSAAMLSRAVAGTIGDRLVFCVPGSPKAVRLAWEKLIRPELRHLVWEMDR
jgi:molybdenum cofactor biosynthesis protein B